MPNRECITHHLACDCREAMHREVAEALAFMVESTERWNASVEAIIGRQPQTGIDLQQAKAALTKYREMSR